MRKRKKLLYLLFISLFSFGVLFYLVIFFPPKFKVPLFTLEIPILPIAALSLYICLWSFFWFIFIDKRRAIFIATAALTYLTLRFYDLTQPLFLILTIILFVCIELLFKTREKVVRK